jgi:hypothetical protein
MSETSRPAEPTARSHRALWPRWAWLLVVLVVVGAGVAVVTRLVVASTPTPTAGTSAQPTPSAADAETPSPTSSPTTAVPTASPTPLPTTAVAPTAAVVAEGWLVHPDAPFGVGGVAAWTGEELVVGAGACCAALAPPEFSAYHLATETWRPLPDHPVVCRSGDAAVWTGEELIFVGGFTTPTCVMPGTNEPSEGIDSFALDVRSGTWRTLPPTPRELGTVDHLVWTGSDVLVLGREWFDPTDPVLLLRYDPAADAWAEAPALPGPARRGFAAVWTGERMLVWGGDYQRSPWPEEEWKELVDGWAYDPDTDTWTSIAPAPLPGASRPYTAWTGTEMVIWGGLVRGPEVDKASTGGAAYDPVTDTWRDLPDLPVDVLPDRLSDPEPWAFAWTGTEFIVWIRGMTDHEWTTLGAAYNPSAGTCRVLPSTPMYSAASATWTGHSVLLTGSLIDDVHGGPPGQRLVEYHPGPTHVRD